MRGGAEREPEAGARTPVERQHRVRREAREERAGTLSGDRRGERPIEHDGVAVVEWMRGQRGRIDPLDVEPEIPKRGRGARERKDRSADVVAKPRQRHLGRATTASDRRRGFVHDDAKARAREPDRCGEAVRAGADHDRALQARRVQVSSCLIGDR